MPNNRMRAQYRLARYRTRKLAIALPLTLLFVPLAASLHPESQLIHLVCIPAASILAALLIHLDHTQQYAHELRTTEAA